MPKIEFDDVAKMCFLSYEKQPKDLMMKKWLP